MLINLLDQHPDIKCCGELFKMKDERQILHPSYTFDYQKKSKSIGYRLAPKKIVTNHLKRSIKNTKEKFGFKLMQAQIDKVPALLPSLRALDFQFIALLRRDIVRQSLSLEMARSTKSWTNVNGIEQAMVHIDLAELERTLEYLSRNKDALSKVVENESVHVIEYESLIVNRDEVWTGLLRQLGVNSVFIPNEKLKKSSSQLYGERISNYDEVRDFYLAKGFNSIPQ